MTDPETWPDEPSGNATDAAARLPLVMCRQCGYFVSAKREEGSLSALRPVCPECGGTEFKDVREE
ncbi:hypothetical protein [Halorussus salinus]|uniref:hypothetical protein n=1 Tax=Halorussus salinus TaxID=1364935 RepID=UPI0010925DC9|nr:hypothetical protein [Halorussus salinus]